MFLNEYLFLKGRNLTLETVFALDEHNGKEISHKFVGAFEVIAFYTFLDYENFYSKVEKHSSNYLTLSPTKFLRLYFLRSRLTVRICLSFLD